MKLFIRNVVFTTIFFSTPVLADQPNSSAATMSNAPVTKSDYIAEFQKLANECNAKLNKGTGADRMWRVCSAVCGKAAKDLGEWQQDPQRALSYAKKRMVKCGNNYKAGIDYEQRVKH